MQEHIRRAHPEHYIAKLPATEESFMLMISTSPSERPPVQPTSGPSQASQGRGVSHGYRPDESNGLATPRKVEEYSGGAMYPAAAALAQLHNHKSDHGWDSDGVSEYLYSGYHVLHECSNPVRQDWHSDHEGGRRPRSSIELPPLHLSGGDVTSAPLPTLESARQRNLLPSIMSHSPPGRSSTLPPLHRPLGSYRPRKPSISKRAHHRRKSKGHHLGAEWLRRIQNDGPDLLRPGGYDRKALSAEPGGDYGKRWEDLIDAATSATEDIDEDRTPVSLKFRSMVDPRLTSQVPQSPVSIPRASLPPSTQNAHTGYQASPLQQGLTPPPYSHDVPEPFPSVESGGSGDHFHIESRGLSDSSPNYSSQNTQIYCAACQGVSFLRESYACTECICGLCQACVDVLMGEQGARRKCPRCATIGGRFKPFQLDIR